MTRYRVSFDRIGRHHQVPALDVTTTTAHPEDELADQILRYARRFLRTRHHEVIVAASLATGSIIVGGIRPGGEFTISARPAALDLPQIAAACPTCGAEPDALCRSHGGTRERRNDTHRARRDTWAESQKAGAR